MIFVYVLSTRSIVELKTPFETWIISFDVNVVSLFHLSYLITLMAYDGLWWTPNIQIKYFMYDRSNYTVFALNRGWKRDSLQIMIFVYVWSNRIIVELKTCFETWITRNDVDGASSFHLSYLIAPLAYLCSQWTPNVKIKYFMIDWC
jgi:hypothetical protein